ncbi:hypothetical protein C7C46_13570 [Streptomyces tateyamensis]|uniref:DUF4235 domain-containing protein n=1 Tax=Streptomyces tateyamensis TaxID=565073 RepID=A0A2V4NK99_9ACTN|nr:DUF4235 domain-containing protein [Streptomyces tateyamensis]PYC79978.1 hypothetical protein C7C46_13570 [Streptomyces tateyamensis]
MIKIPYKPLGLVIGALGGVVASAVFKRLWALVGYGEDTPQPTDQDRSWTEVLTAAALQGAIFALVKAAVDRGGAAGTRRLTGRWPD